MSTATERMVKQNLAQVRLVALAEWMKAGRRAINAMLYKQDAKRFAHLRGTF